MKRLLSFILILAIALTFATINVSAGPASVSLSGPSSAESGSTITFSATASSSAGITSFAASINAGDGIVVQSVSGCPAGWNPQSTNNKIVIAGATAVNSVEVQITCKITGDVGTSKTIAISGISTSDTNGDDSTDYPATISKSVSIAAPKSGETRLASLSVKGQTLSPSFSPDTTTYTIDAVDYDVSSLNVSATCKDSEASLTITGTSLVVGANNVKVTVTAPNGTTKTYVIKVERKQDPNYKESSDGTLSELKVSEGTLSPAFSPKVKEYVVYLPYEIEKISATGKATSALAKGVVNVEDQELKVGKNTIEVTCTAEDDSITAYTIYVVRMDEFGNIDDLGLPASLVGTETETTTTAKTETESKGGFSPVLAVIMAIVCLVFGVGIGALIFRGKVDDTEEPDEEGMGEETFELEKLLTKEEAPKIAIPGYEKYLTGTDEDEISSGSLDEDTASKPSKKGNKTSGKKTKKVVEPEVEIEPVAEVASDAIAEQPSVEKSKAEKKATVKKKAKVKKAPIPDEYEDISSSSEKVQYKTYEDYLNELDEK